MVAQIRSDLQEFGSADYAEEETWREQLAAEGDPLPADMLTNAELGTAWLAAQAGFAVQEVGGYGLLAALRADGTFLAGGLSRSEVEYKARLALALDARCSFCECEACICQPEPASEERTFEMLRGEWKEVVTR